MKTLLIYKPRLGDFLWWILLFFISFSEGAELTADQKTRLASQHLERAKLYAAQKKFKDSEKQVGQSISLAPGWSEPRAFHGDLLKKQNLLPQAIESYKIALSIDRNLKQVVINLAKCYLEIDQWQLALKLIDTYTWDGVDQMYLYLVRGKSWHARGNIKKAEKNYKTLIKIKQTNQNDLIYLDGYLILAEFYYQTDQQRKLIQILEQGRDKLNELLENEIEKKDFFYLTQEQNGQLHYEQSYTFWQNRFIEKRLKKDLLNKTYKNIPFYLEDATRIEAGSALSELLRSYQSVFLSKKITHPDPKVYQWLAHPLKWHLISLAYLDKKDIFAAYKAAKMGERENPGQIIFYWLIAECAALDQSYYLQEIYLKKILKKNIPSKLRNQSLLALASNYFVRAKAVEAYRLLRGLSQKIHDMKFSKLKMEKDIELGFFAIQQKNYSEARKFFSSWRKEDNSIVTLGYFRTLLGERNLSKLNTQLVSYFNSKKNVPVYVYEFMLDYWLWIKKGNDQVLISKVRDILSKYFGGENTIRYYLNATLSDVYGDLKITEKERHQALMDMAEYYRFDKSQKSNEQYLKYLTQLIEIKINPEVKITFNYHRVYYALQIQQLKNQLNRYEKVVVAKNHWKKNLKIHKNTRVIDQFYLDYLIQLETEFQQFFHLRHKKQPEEILSHIERLKQNYSHEPYFYERATSQLFALNFLKEAYSMAIKGLSYFPDNAILKVHVARYFNLMHYPEKAEDFSKQAIKEEGLLDAYATYLKSLFIRNSWKRIQQVISVGKKQLGDKQIFTEYQGYRKYQENNHVSAQVDFENGLDLYPASPISFHNLGMIAFKRGEYEKSKRLFRQATLRSSQVGLSLYYYCYAEFSSGNNSKALEIAKLGKDLYPEEANWCYAQGRILEESLKSVPLANYGSTRINALTAYENGIALSGTKEYIRSWCQDGIARLKKPNSLRNYFLLESSLSGRPAIEEINGEYYAFLCLKNQKVQCVRLIDAAVIWEKEIDGNASLPVTHNQTHLLVGTDSGKMYKIEKATGDLKSIYQGDHPPMIKPHFFGKHSYIFSTFSATTLLVEGNSIRMKSKHDALPSTSPLFYNNKIYIGLENQTMNAYDIFTGDMVWRLPLDGVPRGIIHEMEGKLYFASEDFSYRAIDAESGMPKFIYKNEFPPISSQISVDDKLLCIGPQGDLRLIDIDGTHYWDAKVPANVSTQSHVKDGKIFVPQSNSTVSILAWGTGKELIRVQLKQPSFSQTVLIKPNLLCSLSEDGGIYHYVIHW